MKKIGNCYLLWGRWSNHLLKMKLLFLFCIVSVFQLSAEVFSQNARISLSMNNAKLSEIFDKIEDLSDVTFLYRDAEVLPIGGISVDVSNRLVSEVVMMCLEDTKLSYKFVDNTVVLTTKSAKELAADPVKKITIKGKVTDKKGEPLPGVSVGIKGSNLGVSTDVDGNFSLTVVEKKNLVLLFSFIGMKSQELKYNKQQKIVVVMKDNDQKLDDVVVTGYSNINKSSFTGSAVTVTKDDLLKVSKTNIVAALQSFDPSFRIQENNEWGSDPNALPEMYIRGRSGIGVKDLDRSVLSKSSLKDNPNLPIFIMDGFQVSVQKLYDFDPNRIESITILKDAASTAIYGSRAANGVVVITTVTPKAGKLNVTYNFTGRVTVPDLSDYNLMNSRELIATEVAAGFYEGEGFHEKQQLIKELNGKYNNLARGIDTYWLSKPLRSVFNSKHSIFIETGSDNIRFGVNANYNKEDGVMKDSYRDRIGGGFYVDYRVNKFQIRNSISYNVINAQDSPYGSFNEYSSALPYDRYTDDEGMPLRLLHEWHSLSSDRTNPLYESTLKNFSRNSYEELINNTSINYYVNNHLSIKGQFSITKQSSINEYFLDPLSNRNVDKLSVRNLSSGTYRETKGDRLDWNANFLVAYNRSISDHNINLTVGLNAVSNSSEDISSEYRGFPSGTLSSINFAEEIYEKPTKSENRNRLIGFLTNLNYTYNNIYLLDASCRLDGSSEFGSDNKFAPFWSTGVGINIHKYKFLEDNYIISLLKVRASYGSSGKVNFPAYVARTTYDILSKDWYRTGFGTSLKALGNMDLTWEKTNTLDYGFELGLFDNKLYMKAAYYNKRTVDLITQVTVPTSSGFSQFYDNMGEVENKGLELTVRGSVIKTEDIDLTLYANIASNKNKILAISKSLKAYNDKVDDYYESRYSGNIEVSKPLSKYQEGASLTAIYGMKSLGIDPATGQEIFEKRNGEITRTWDPKEQIVLGDREPTAQGAFGFNYRYKQFSLYTSFMYQFGGQTYNSTLVTKVENARIYNENVDKRVFDDRWKQPGDITIYKSIADDSGYTKPSSRFVQDYNVVSLSSITAGYDFKANWMKTAHISMLRFELGSNNLFRISSVKQERGTSYPFARTVNISLKASF